jgi:hypothetical protein
MIMFFCTKNSLNSSLIHLIKVKICEKMYSLKEKTMTNRKFWLGMLVMTLVFGMMVLGCENGTTSDVDIWSDVTSLSQLDGTWKGSITDTETEEGITVKTVMEMTMIINANAGTASGTMKMTMTFSGNGINEIWAFIKGTFTGGGITFNDSNHSITMTETLPTEPISLSDMDDVKINQNGTKLKFPFGSGDEIIMLKQ